MKPEGGKDVVSGKKEAFAGNHTLRLSRRSEGSLRVGLRS